MGTRTRPRRSGDSGSSSAKNEAPSLGTCDVVIITIMFISVIVGHLGHYHCPVSSLVTFVSYDVISIL